MTTSFLPCLRAGLVCLIAVAGLAPAHLSAQGKQPTADSAWLVAPAAGATTAAVYVEISNPGMYDIFIVKAAAPGVAGKVELRGAAASSGESPAVSEYPVPAYGSTSAAAGQPHLRLLEIAKPLKAGDAVDLILTTEAGIELKVSAKVRAQ
jgi:copper(I)-binding protein